MSESLTRKALNDLSSSRIFESSGAISPTERDRAEGGVVGRRQLGLGLLREAQALQGVVPTSGAVEPLGLKKRS